MQGKSHATIVLGDAAAALDYAKNAAASLLCEENGVACGHCRTCRKVAADNHPDVHLVDDTGQSVGVDAIRQMVANAHIRPFEAEAKVYIIKRAEEMTVQAQNALLKTLEEPPNNTFFFLCGQAIGKLLPTVISRCILARVQKQAPASVRRGLEKEGANALVAYVAVCAAGGATEEARALARDPAFGTGEQTVRLLCEAVCGEEKALGLFEKVISGVRDKEKMAGQIAWIQTLALDALQGGAVHVLDGYGAAVAALKEKMTRKGALALLKATGLAQRQLAANVSVAAVADGLVTAISKEIYTCQT
jgi:DNA polymerase III delta' subunit